MIIGSVHYTIGKHDLNLTNDGWIDADMNLRDWYDCSSLDGYAIDALLLDGHRANANVIAKQLYYLDIDHIDCKLDETLQDDFVQAHAAYMYTTCNYRADGPQKHRIAYALAEPLTNHDEIQSMTYALIYLREYPYLDAPLYDAKGKRVTRCDAACVDASRLYTGNPSPAYRHYYGNILSMNDARLMIDNFADLGRELVNGRPVNTPVIQTMPHKMANDEKQQILDALMSNYTILTPENSYKTIHRIANAMLTIGYSSYDVDCVVRHIGQSRDDIGRLINRFADRQATHNASWSGPKVGYSTIKSFLCDCGHPDYQNTKLSMPPWMIGKIRKIIASDMNPHDAYKAFMGILTKYSLGEIAKTIVDIFCEKYPQETLYQQQLRATL